MNEADPETISEPATLLPPAQDISLWQMAAVALCEFACGYEHGRGKDEPAYREVTEGRDVGMMRAHYSSCGDQGHWLLQRLGLAERWLNRSSLNQYGVGLNIARLGLGCPISHVAPTSADWAGPQPGDICLIWNSASGSDAHCFVCLGPGSDAGHIRTANYGAGGMSSAAFPGANIANSPFVHREDGWYVGLAHPRKLQRTIKLGDAIALRKHQPNLTGAKLTGEVIDALGARWDPL